MIRLWDRALVLGACVMLCGATSASAASLAGTFTDSTDNYNITVNYNRVANYSPGIDQITFTIGTISDGANNGKVNDLGGLASQGVLSRVTQTLRFFPRGAARPSSILMTPIRTTSGLSRPRLGRTSILTLTLAKALAAMRWCRTKTAA